MTNEERETIIRRSASDKAFDVWSDVPRDIRRLRKSAAAFGCEIEEYASGAIRVRELPIRAITFRASGKGRPGNSDALNASRNRSKTEEIEDMEAHP